jgi:hypothetical protein
MSPLKYLLSSPFGSPAAIARSNAVHVCGESWVSAAEVAEFRIESAVLGGLAANDGVVVLRAPAVALRIQRDRGDLFVDVAQSGTEDWQPAWLLIHYFERSLSPSAVGQLDDLAYRDKFFELLPRTLALLANSEQLQAFRDFLATYRPLQ